MSIPKSALLTHFDYSLWASSKLLDACTRLTPEELTRDLKVSHDSILGTLQHIYYADRVWLARLEGRNQKFADDGDGPSLGELKEAWPTVLKGFNHFIAEATDELLFEDLHYHRLNGDSCATARWKLLLHIVNHATLHRGQVMGMLRQIGHVPPGTDYLFYHLQLGH